jgi:hypothetical protein
VVPLANYFHQNPAEFRQQGATGPEKQPKTDSQREFKQIALKGLTRTWYPSYINKAVEGNSELRTTKVAPGANLSALNLDNYIV